MRFAIAYSKLDPAGVNIIRQLKANGFLPQIPILDFSKEIVYADEITRKKYPVLNNIEFIVFASKHQSAKKEHSLSLHAPGNWRNADFGGKPGKTCRTSGFVLKYLFQELNKNYKESRDKQNLSTDYNITLEVTHHGPLIDIPCCFIEIGSSEEQWNDEQAAKIIARTILSLQNFNSVNSHQWIPTIGIGGPHYAPNFNKIQLNSNYAISHIIPEYSLPLIESMLKEAEKKTTEQVKEVLLDWKGCGNSESRQNTINVIEKYGLKHKRTDKIEK